MGLLDTIKSKLSGKGKKASATAGNKGDEGLKAKVQDVAAKLDDKAEDLSKREGTVGEAAEKAHEVLDKVDGD